MKLGVVVLKLKRGDRVVFAEPLTAGPVPHPVTTGRVVRATRFEVAIKLPGQRSLFACLPYEVPRCRLT